MNAIMRLHRAQMGAQGGGGGSKYIEFADPEVFRVLMEHGVSSDGIGITLADAEAVTSMNGWYLNNTSITRFNELSKFTGMTELSPKNDGGYGSAIFRGATSLEEITIPKNVNRIGSYTFSICSSLKDVHFDSKESILYVNAGAFDSCTLWNGQVDFPNLIELGGNAFSKSGVNKVLSLGSITILQGAPNTGYSSGMFRDCKSLTYVNLPETLQTIGINVFMGCTSLSSINLPSSIEVVGAQAFHNCTSLEIDDLSLPNLTSLGSNAFYGVKIKKISNLGKITALPTGTSSTQNFGNKSTLTEVVLPDTLTSIPQYSFSGYAALANCDIPSTCTYIGSRAFYGANSLSTIVCHATTPPTIASDTFGSNASDFAIYVPDASVDAYKTATNWATYADQIKPLSELNA